MIVMRVNWGGLELYQRSPTDWLVKNMCIYTMLSTYMSVKPDKQQGLEQIQQNTGINLN